MSNLTRIFTAAAFAAASLVAVAGSAGAQTSGQSAPDAPRQCGVTVDRSAEAGLFRVARQEFDNGRCVCAVTTGPDSQSDLIEDQVLNIVRGRVCQDAPAVNVPTSGGGVASGGGGGFAVGLGGLSALAILGGLIIALDGDDRPVSP
jgi:hypothetical protein